MESKISFKNGDYKLNDDPNYNFQLNRVIMWDGGRIEDVEKVSQSIKTSGDWKQTLIALGEQAENEGRIENAIAYYRMSEFFMYDGDPDKLAYYKKSTNMFYDYYSEYFDEGMVEKLQIPYEGVNLPVMHVKAKGRKKDTILFHGETTVILRNCFSQCCILQSMVLRYIYLKARDRVELCVCMECRFHINGKNLLQLFVMRLI